MTRRLVKSVLRSAAARLYGASRHFLAHVTGKILILLYHRVIPRGDLVTTFVQPGMYVTPETLERHLLFLTAHFKLLSFDDLLARWDRESWDAAERYCVVTFDDGWLDNYRYAYPLLRKYRVPATIFLPTDLIGTREWLWPDTLGYLLRQYHSGGAPGTARGPADPATTRHLWQNALNGGAATETIDSVIELAKTLPEQARERLLHTLGEAAGIRTPGDRLLLNWDEVWEMSHNGIAFGSHSCTHTILTCLDRTRLQHELRRSLDVLRQYCVNHVPVLSYPNGDYTEAVLAEARAAGYRAAVTTDPGLESSRPADLFRLRRIGVHEDVSRSVRLLAFHIARHARPMAAIT